MIYDNLEGEISSYSEISYIAEKRSGDIVKVEKRAQHSKFTDRIKKFNDKGKLIEQKLYYSDGTIYLEEEYIYDEENNLTKIKGRTVNRGLKTTNIIDEEKNYIYNSNGNKVKAKYYTDSSLVLKRIYKYDDKGLLSKIKIKSWPMKNVYKKDREGNLIKSEYWDKFYKSKEVYKYDNKGNKIKHKKFNSDGTKDTSTYSKNGTKQGSKFHSSDGSLISKEVWEFDINGNKIEYIKYDTDLKIIDKTNYEYNSHNKLTTTYSYIDKETLSYKSLYKYDEKHNLIEEVDEYVIGEYVTRNSTQYVYDEIGNWIKKIDISDNAPSYIIERNYEYF